jgi:CBS domain containing-hemolysin-like protein
MSVFLIILALILLNGFFVAAEFSLIGAHPGALERAASRGSKAAAWVLERKQNPAQQDRYIATAQLGITCASLGLGMYGEHALAIALEEPLGALGIPGLASPGGLSMVLAVTVLTFWHIVLGEMMPKTLALHSPGPTVEGVAVLMRWVERALLPIVSLLNWVGAVLLARIGIVRSHKKSPAHAAALRFVVDESVAQGEIDTEAGDVLSELFEFGDLTAARVMTPRVRIVGIRRNATALEVRAAVRTARHARYPIFDGNLDEILGFVLIRDLFQLLLTGGTLDDTLIRPVPFVRETTNLDKVLSRMREEKTQIVVVMDEHGGTSGIVTIEDLFEEVVGEISDGPAPPQPVAEVQGELHALGRARLDEVGEQLGLEIDHPDVDTVSGLVLTLLDRPPKIGDRVTYAGVEFCVLSTLGRGVHECRLTIDQAEARAAPASSHRLPLLQDTEEK